MLTALSIQDFVIVDRLRLEFEPGFTVLTGETGAGKSILVDALLLVLGARADPGMIRAGRDKADITAEFDVRNIVPAVATLEEMDLSGEDGECVVRRVIDGSGRSRAFINGRPATLGQLRDLGERLVDIHGQHEHQSLVQPREQRALLDAFAGAASVVAEVASAHRALVSARRALAEARTGGQALADERDRLSWQVQELQRAGFSQEEWDRLRADHLRLSNAAALIEGAEAGMEVLSEGDRAVLREVGALRVRLAHLAEHDPSLASVVGLLEPAEIQLKEAALELRQYRSRVDLDPERLQEVEARIGAVMSVSRKYRVAPEALPGVLDEARARLAALGDALDVEALQHEAARAERAWQSAASGLTSLRARTADILSQSVSAAMQDLAMAGGRFEVALEPLAEPSAHGAEQVEFLVAAHPGANPAPVARVASGGELARLSLAIRTVTSRVAPVPTLVFDEVDSGIGGGVAEVVGRLLRGLGRDRQVFCITHLPQVAATATHQWRVSKHAQGGVTLSSVETLDAAERVEELARMLGGVTITDTTRQHAREMLGSASGGDRKPEDPLRGGQSSPGEGS